MGVQRYDEAKAWLQRAAAGEPDTAEQAYNELAELARWQGVSGHEVDAISGPHRHLKAAREALDRQDFASAVEAAVKVFEYDDSTTNNKAMASIIAAVALHHQGHDDQADLYAGWAEQHGDADQKSEARSLRARWAGIEKADRSMDDGVTAKEVAAVIEAAEEAWAGADWERTIALLRELLGSAPKLDGWQSNRVHWMLGDALRSTQRYPEALAEYEQVTSDDTGMIAMLLKDVREMMELGEQLGS
jgi:tetratricopeptide (TPR) repeat protein